MIVTGQTFLASKGQFLFFSHSLNFLPVWPALFLPLFLQFSLRPPHHRVKFYENLRSAIWKLRGSFFLPLFQPISVSRGIKRKEWVNKDKDRKKWIYAEISVALSAQKRPFYAVLLRFASALAKVNAKQEKKEKEWKKEISYGFPVHLELPVHP